MTIRLYGGRVAPVRPRHSPGAVWVRGRAQRGPLEPAGLNRVFCARERAGLAAAGATRRPGIEKGRGQAKCLASSLVSQIHQRLAGKQPSLDNTQLASCLSDDVHSVVDVLRLVRSGDRGPQAGHPLGNGG